MNGLKTLVVLMAFAIAFSAIAFAQEAEEVSNPTTEKEMKAAKMKKHHMYGMMMKKMMEKQMVATKDGGVVVMVGKKLFKYDRNLNLVKEVELNIDYKAMKRELKERCKKYKEKTGE
jgi:Na+/H+ antiporter NhaB